FRGPGKPQQLVYQRIDSVDLVPDQVRKGAAEIRVLVTLRQQLRESLDRNERVLDFVSHAGGERAETGQPVAAADLQFKPFKGGDVSQYHERAQHFALLPVENRAA